MKKKEEERWLLEKFISTEGQFEEIFTSLEPIKNEPPDFKVSTFDELDISIEITKAINPNLKQAESAQEKIVRDAFKKFKRYSNELLRVFVTFSSKPLKFNLPFLNRLSNELFEIVKNVCEKNNGFDFNVTTKDTTLLHEHFQQIHIGNKLNFENWQPFGAFMVPHIDEDWFRERIEIKEKNIINYDEKFDENWLLIFADFGHKSSAHRFSFLKENYEDYSFDRIYVYQYFSRKIIQLK